MNNYTNTDDGKPAIVVYLYIVLSTQKETSSQSDQHLVISSSKAYVFEDKMTKY